MEMLASAAESARAAEHREEESTNTAAEEKHPEKETNEAECAKDARGTEQESAKKPAAKKQVAKKATVRKEPRNEDLHRGKDSSTSGSGKPRSLLAVAARRRKETSASLKQARAKAAPKYIYNQTQPSQEDMRKLEELAQNWAEQDSNLTLPDIVERAGKHMFKHCMEAGSSIAPLTQLEKFL